MPAPISSALSVIGSLFGAQARAEQNDRLKAQDIKQGDYANTITGYGNDVSKLVAQVLQQQGGYTDQNGGGLTYDPATGQWKVNASKVDQSIQGASDTEELSRLTLDQAMRRRGMQGAESLRGAAEGDANATRTDLANFRSGVGQVDPNKISSSLRVDRTAAVNAGYDDAARAANTLSLRQGAGAGDAASVIARNRAADIARTMGTPDVEGLQIAEGINQGRLASKTNSFNGFNQQGSAFVDSAFAPSQRFNNGLDRLFAEKQALTARQGQAMDGKAVAGQLAGSAAAGMRASSNIKNAGTDTNIWGPVFSGASKIALGAGK